MAVGLGPAAGSTASMERAERLLPKNRLRHGSPRPEPIFSEEGYDVNDPRSQAGGHVCCIDLGLLS